MRALAPVLLLATLVTGCRGCKSEGVGGYERCAELDAPSERTLQTDALKLEIRERTATLTPRGPLTIAAFTGPVDGPLARSDMEPLAKSGAQLVLYLGGLGATEELATANLALLATLRIPVLFLAGGADHPAVLKAAFDELEGEAAERLIHASGLRVLSVGSQRFALVPGAPLGRYALDDEACGFGPDDLEALRDALGEGAKQRTWLLAWAAPAGFGVGRGFAGLETGSPELAAFAKELGIQGGLFAYPEVQAALPSAGAGGSFALVVPRLGRTGSLREGRGFVPRGLSLVTLDGAGLALSTRP